VKQMRAERHDAIAAARLPTTEAASLAEAGDLHARQVTRGPFPFDEPDAGTVARIEDRTDRYLQRRRGPAVRYLHGDRRAERRVCQRTLQHVPSLEGSGLTVCSLDNWRSFADARQPPSVQGRPRGSGRGTQSFGKSMTASRRPACATRTTTCRHDDLTRLRQRLDYDAIRVREQHGVARVIARQRRLGPRPR
jgi:hypothetical protein